jgi:hypothetical protein
MFALGLSALCFAWVQQPAQHESTDFMEPWGPLERSHLRAGPLPAERSKKALWLEDKQRRPRVRVTAQRLTEAQLASLAKPKKAAPKNALPLLFPLPGSRILPITTLFSIHVKEALPLLPGRSEYAEFKRLLRDHYSNQATEVDPALLEAVKGAATKFASNRVEVVSGYRSPKFNLSLRKKGHEVAQTSQHCEGKAVDFRLRGVKTKELWAYVRGLKLGGVGIYPQSAFVHCDTGPIRFWKGN